MNLTQIIQLRDAASNVCPKCGNEIKAGGPGSGPNAPCPQCGPKGPRKVVPVFEKPKWVVITRDAAGKPVLIRGIVNGKNVVLEKKFDHLNGGPMRWVLQDAEGKNIHDWFSLNHAKWNIGKNPDKFVKPGQDILDRRQFKTAPKPKGPALIEDVMKELGMPLPKAPVHGPQSKRVLDEMKRIKDARLKEKEELEKGQAPISDSPLAHMSVKKSEAFKGGGMMGHKYVLTMEDGSKVFFKGVKGEYPAREQIKPGTYYKREALAYDFAKEMGMAEMVPETVIMEYDGQIGSGQRWNDKAKMAGDVPHWADEVDPLDLQKAAALDYMMGNTDRHRGNFMLEPIAGKPYQKLVLIDHGLMFPAEFDINRGNTDIMRKAKSRHGPGNIPHEVKSSFTPEAKEHLTSFMTAKKMKGTEIIAMQNRFDEVVRAKTWNDLLHDMAPGWW